MRARWRGERKSETDNGVMLELGWAERRTEVWGNLKKLGRSAVRAIANGQPEGTAAASELAHKRHGHHFLPSPRDAAGQCVEKVRILSPGHSRRRRTQTPATLTTGGWLPACLLLQLVRARLSKRERVAVVVAVVALGWELTDSIAFQLTRNRSS